MSIDLGISKIDFQKLLVNDKEELEQLAKAVAETGFLIVHNTDISVDAVNAIISTYRDFFHKDESFKAEYDMANTGSNRGWGRPKAEQVNPEANPDYKEIFDAGVELDEDDPLREITYYAPNLWPSAEMKNAVLNYYDEAQKVSLVILKSIANAIDLDANFFDDKFSPPMALLRANFYPPRQAHHGDKDFGIAEHTDYGCLTLLAADGVPGLEVLMPGDKWLSVNAPPGAFIINFGEMLESWSNHKIKATLHRVIGTKKERISIPFFFNPSYDTDVSAEGEPEIKAGDYLSKRYNETYLHRKNNDKNEN